MWTIIMRLLCDEKIAQISLIVFMSQLESYIYYSINLYLDNWFL